MFLDLCWETVTGLYAIHYLARRDEPVPMAEIAGNGNLAPPSLAKVLQRLRRSGLVRSERGRGFILARRANDISVLDVVRALEGSPAFEGLCLMKNALCDLRHICPLSRLCGELTAGITTALEGIKIDGLPVGAKGLPVCMDHRRRRVESEA